MDLVHIDIILRLTSLELFYYLAGKVIQFDLNKKDLSIAKELMEEYGKWEFIRMLATYDFKPKKKYYSQLDDIYFVNEVRKSLIKETVENRSYPYEYQGF